MSLTVCQNTDDNNNNNSNQGQMNEPAEGGDVTIYRLCAPIASLDCMEEFSGNTGLDLRRSVSLGSKASLKNVSSTPGECKVKSSIVNYTQFVTVLKGLRYKNIGKSGLRVSNVALGTWSVFSTGISEDQAEAIIKLAYESGINLFDLSDLHSGPRAEVEMGNILKKMNWKRMTYVVTVKIYWSSKGEERGLSRKHIIESVRASLKRLQLDYIDIVIIHRADSMCPMEEIVRAMNYVIDKGWVMYWGSSKWSTTEIMEAYTNCREFNCVTPIMEQSEYHMFCRERAELYLPEMYNKIGVGLMAWGPLGMYLTENSERLFFTKGSLRSKTQNSSWTEDEVAKEDRVDEAKKHLEKVRDLNLLSEKLGCSLTQLSIAWTLKHEPVHCLLISAKTVEQLTQSLQALQLLPRLSVSVMLEIERILDNKPVRPPMISTLQMRGLISHVGPDIVEN
ncbi:CLUMA_CG003114, isoform A [Clunio marinus]|uniref:CLUMA_CG003114, isoform A n=1 Tax=Clunio marinus TaxID=568069 RepID=A0A1J1HSA1_9DIPT|nr:CLUMA_CG003114, isoform A [Clunio marinus]